MTGSPATSAEADSSRFPPSAGLGHRLLAREFAGHQDTILKKIGLQADLRDR
jgi:hypothetical protein